VISAPLASEPAVTCTIKRDANAPWQARSAIRQLEGHCAPALLDQLELVASELVTNTVRHANSGEDTSLAVLVSSNRVVVEVASRGPTFDRDAMKETPGVDGGFGLRVVDALADRWWVEHDTETRVICEFDLPR
jgi:anti-sigma regulatory factor (Ser/Thr protein kinase)